MRRNRRLDFSDSFAWMLLAFLIAFAYGWIANLIALIASETMTGLVIARAIGVVVAPLGAILGFF